MPLPNKNDDPFIIVADDRERNSEVIPSLMEMADVTVDIRRLSVGDYQTDNRLVFERKTLSDFAISIIDGRLFKQMIRLANSRTSLILGIPVLRSKEPLETAKLMVYATRQIRSVTGGGIQRPGYRPKNIRTRQLYILQGLPGIGRERASRLLNRFGSVEAVITASRDELESVDGIGKDTADKIKWAISEKITPYGLYDDFPI